MLAALASAMRHAEACAAFRRLGAVLRLAALASAMLLAVVCAATCRLGAALKLAALASAMRYAEPGAALRRLGAALMLTWLSITTHCHAHKAEYGGTTPPWRCCKELALARQDCRALRDLRWAKSCVTSHHVCIIACMCRLGLAGAGAEREREARDSFSFICQIGFNLSSTCTLIPR